jgi:hypothetical protein
MSAGRTILRGLLAAACFVTAARAQASGQGGEPGRSQDGYQDSAVAKPRAEVDADPMASAWLHDVLGSGRTVTLSAYRSIVDDPAAPSDQRIRAAARGLALAATSGDSDAVPWARTLTDLVPLRPHHDPEALVQRLRPSAELRAFIDADKDIDPERVRNMIQRLTTEPWRTVEALATRPALPLEALERALRAAEARGDKAEAERIRQELMPRQAPDALRPRVLQLRRWARDVLKAELAGEHDKAERLLTALTRRRGARGPFTLARFEFEMRSNLDARVTTHERGLLEQALHEARRRSVANEPRGVDPLVVPALYLLLRP